MTIHLKSTTRPKSIRKPASKLLGKTSGGHTAPLHELKDAATFDPTLQFSSKITDQLASKYIAPQKYSREKLYSSMLAGKTIIFTDYPITLKKALNETNADTLVRMLKDGLPKNEKIMIRAGASRTLHKVTINDAIERWLRKRSKFGVTDLHFRNTRFYDNIDAEAISYFNLLPHCPYDAAFLEMLTLVISSRGIFSDSHSDDGDGSNHCFTGKKLWLAWDRVEGQKHGLQDCTYDSVYDQAAFDMRTFASLKTAHWFIVSDNRTLFMPGNFTHKVVTLEPYIGFGSFYVSLPNYFHTLTRWILFDTSDVKGDFLNIMNKQSMKMLNTLSNAAKEKMGFPYFKKGIKQWKEGLSSKQIAQLEENEIFKNFLQFARSV